LELAHSLVTGAGLEELLKVGDVSDERRLLLVELLDSLRLLDLLDLDGMHLQRLRQVTGRDLSLGHHWR